MSQQMRTCIQYTETRIKMVPHQGLFKMQSAGVLYGICDF